MFKLSRTTEQTIARGGTPRSMNLNRLAQRWERRQQEGALDEQRERFDEHEREPLLLVSVREHLEIARAAALVWRFAVDPGDAALLGEDPAALGFTVPGTLAGQVGERQCLFTHRVDGALIGSVEEIVDLVPSARIVARSLSTMHASAGALEVAELDDRSCRLTYELTAEVHPEQEQAFRDEASRTARRMLARVAHHLDGVPLELAPLPLARPLDPRHAELELVVVVARAMVDTAAAPGRVWAFILDASNDRLNSADPDAIACSVPGTQLATSGSCAA